MRAVLGDAGAMRHVTGRALTAAEVAHWVERRIDLERERGFTMWTVALRDSGEVIGDCGLCPLALKGPEIEVGYHFAPAHWGKGYATEAARACVDYAFETLHLDRLVAVTHPDNTPSARVLEKCGFTRCGATDVYAPGDPLYELTRDRRREST